MPDWAVGVDIGGTNLRTAAISQQGDTLESVSRPVDHATGGAGDFRQLIDAIADVVGRVGTAPVGIGIGCTGPVDPALGTIDNPFTLPPSLNGPVRSVLQDAFDRRVVIENDADVAALAEWRYGAARGSSSMVCVTVGTGIGVGVVRDGALFRAVDGGHPEPGHQVVDPRGPECYCGAFGCLESLASGQALAAAARRHGGFPAGVTARDVYEAAATGSSEATELVAVARTALAAGVWNLVSTHSPDAVVLTGNALGVDGEVIRFLQSRIRPFSFQRDGGVVIKRGALEDLAGCLGAASLVLAA